MATDRTRPDQNAGELGMLTGWLEHHRGILMWKCEGATSRQVVAQAASLDVLSKQPSERTREPWSLRWIVTHMIEEYARHNGHADLLRERVDGITGDY
jgi:hypothetical protein